MHPPKRTHTWHRFPKHLYSYTVSAVVVRNTLQSKPGVCRMDLQGTVQHTHAICICLLYNLFIRGKKVAYYCVMNVGKKETKTNWTLHKWRRSEMLWAVKVRHLVWFLFLNGFFQKVGKQSFCCLIGLCNAIIVKRVSLNRGNAVSVSVLNIPVCRGERLHWLLTQQAVDPSLNPAN